MKQDSWSNGTRRSNNTKLLDEGAAGDKLCTSSSSVKLGCCLQTLRRVQNEIGAKFLTECLKLIKHYCLLLTTSLSGYTCETFWVVLIYCNAVKEHNACSMSQIFTLKIINHLTEHLLSSFITVTVLFLKTIPLL